MPQEIVFTVLPHMRMEKEGQPYLKCSVHVSVKLSTSVDTTLSEFEDILTWPQKMLDADFQFRLKNGEVLDADLVADLVDQELYSNIFHKGIRVEDFKVEDLSEKRINSFPIKHINDFILKNYGKVSVESPTRLVTPDLFIDESRFGSISRIKLDESAVNRIENSQHQAKLNAARLVVRKDENENQVRNIIREKKFISFSSTMNPAEDFAQFRIFHKADKKVTTRSELTIEKPAFEFHDIVSVAASYPQILRKMGFVLDFLIPYVTAIPANGTLQLIPNSLLFKEEETTVLTPATAYDINESGFYVTDRNDSVFLKGFVKINSSEFTVVQVDTDGTGLKTNLMAENKIQEIAQFYELRSELSTSSTLKRKQFDEAEPPDDAGLPYMRSAGIAITKNGMAGHLFERIKNNFSISEGFISAQIKTMQVKPSGIRTNVLNSRVDVPGRTEKTRRTLTQDKIPAGAVLKFKEPETILFSGDIVQGYRMDIAYEDNPEKWYSLHQKQDEYTWFDEAKNPHPIQGITPDEGFLQLGITEDPENPDDAFIPETLARWEGWSLSVRKPGYAINDSVEYELKSGETVKRDFVNNSKEIEAKKYSFDPDLEFRINVQSKVVRGSLPKLRFGKDYRVRIRTVDLAGNSVPLEQQSESPLETIRANIRYMRYDPLASPILLVGNELKDGEFLESLVIRSNVDIDSSAYEKKFPVKGTEYDPFSQRYLLPPKNSQQIAENHGMFEKAFQNNLDAAQVIYNLISSREGLYQQDEKNREKVYQPSDVEIVYLPDPMAAGVALFLAEGYENTHSQEFKPRLFSFFANEELTLEQTNVPLPENWYNAGIIRIRLEEGNMNSRWDSASRIFTVFLPKGTRIRIRFSTFWRDNDLKQLSAIWKMIRDESPRNLNEIDLLARSGQHWMISPSRELELVHAVQQPVEAPEIQSIIPTREINKTFALLNARFKVHGESTEKLEIQARWTEPLDDGISVIIKEKKGRNSISDIRINYHDDIITKGTVPKPEELTRPDIRNLQIRPVIQFKQKTIAQFETNPQPDSGKINQLYSIQNKSYTQFLTEKARAQKTLVNKVKYDIQSTRYSFVKQLNLRILPLEHRFGDTKHRWVEYKMTATSRYREYFDKILKQYPDLVPWRESQWTEKINIQSSSRPKAPEIDYVIPTFEWRKMQTAELVRHRRSGGGLRIFLKRPWFSSGEDEMLAVILPDQVSSSNARLVTDRVLGYTNYYTHWGMDPVFYSAVPDNYSPDPGDFRFNPVVDENLQHPDAGNLKAKAVAYPVRFDEERQLWYCDLTIDPQGMYFPFIKLALARYQPYSVRKENEDVCLSPIVFSPMIQLVPERQTTLSFTKDDENSRFTITVEGTIYNDRYAAYGNYNFLKFSFIDSKIAQPIFGLIHDGANERRLDNEGVDIKITQEMVNNNRFKVSKEFKLPRAYRSAPFHIVIEEYERGPAKMTFDFQSRLYDSRIQQSEETDRLIYADIIRINEAGN